MMIDLYDHQINVIDKLENGNILFGETGCGKSRTALAYFYIKVCNAEIEKFSGCKYKLYMMHNPINLYIITTADKRNKKEWETELIPFEFNNYNISIVIDSWNNIKKYINIENSFFIFDEQKVRGYGSWSKSFIKIARKNKWILLSATPADEWKDYAPVFIANGWYKNKTDFYSKHVVLNPYVSYEKVSYYINLDILYMYRKRVLIHVLYNKPTEQHHFKINVEYDKKLEEKIIKTRYDPFNKKPIISKSSLCMVLRHATNMNESRILFLRTIVALRRRIIIFYNFNFEREMILKFAKELNIPISEQNGFSHDKIPENYSSWIHIVNYMSGSEGWNCILSNCIVFFSQSYSYSQTKQAAGRIDRINTVYKDLYYYHLISNSKIDKQIEAALARKMDFNSEDFKYT